MDRFYLENAKFYMKLVDGLDVNAPAAHFSRHQAASTGPSANKSASSAKIEDDDNAAMIITARIRPMLEDDLSAGFPCAAYCRTTPASSGKIIDLHDLYNHPRGKPVLKSTKHTIDRVYGSETSTDTIFEELLISLISFAQAGGLSTLFAYGQTGSGKTYTISELSKLAAVWLIDDKDTAHPGMQLFLTIVDLAGNQAYDLLDARKPIQVLEDEKGDIHLSGAAEREVEDVDMFLELLEEATSFRKTESTTKNDASSRSHSICRVRIKSPEIVAPGGGILYLVDLAGSEAARDITAHTPQLLRETQQINVSLSALKDCVRGRAEAQLAKRLGKVKKVRVPVRASMLTKVLKHVFEVDDGGKTRRGRAGRETKTVVVACVNPSLADMASSKNTLRYAEMLRIGAGGG